MNKILIAVSDKSARSHLGDMLKRSNCSLHFVDEFVGAADAFSSVTPDVIIADIEFTEWFLKQLTQTSQRELPVVCYIKDYNARLAYDLMKRGVYDCITDPLRPIEVVDIINKALSKDIIHFDKTTRQSALDYFTALPVKKKISLAIASAAVAALFLLLIFRKSPPPKNFDDIPHRNITGIIAGRNTIFLSDWFTQSIYRYKRSSGELLGVYYFSDIGPLGIATDGNAIWLVGTDRQVRKCFLDEKLQKLEPVSVSQVSAASPGGICIDGNNLLLTDMQMNKIQVFEIPYQTPGQTASSGGLKLIAEYGTGSISPTGVWRTKETVFLIDSVSGALVSGVIADNKFVPRKEYAVKLPGEKVLALNGDDGKLFLVISGDKTYIRQLPLGKLK